jgi:hypothetical protein
LGSTASASRRRSGKTIPQLGEQEKQSCPPLKVSSDIANHPGLLPGTTLGDYVGDDVQFETAEVVKIFRYEHGKPLIKPDHPPLTTMMRRLHEWYLESCRKNGSDSLMVRIKDEHDLIGVDLMPVEFVELFQLFNQEALDKQIMTCYCL